MDDVIDESSCSRIQTKEHAKNGYPNYKMSVWLKKLYRLSIHLCVFRPSRISIGVLNKKQKTAIIIYDPPCAMYFNRKDCHVATGSACGQDIIPSDSAHVSRPGVRSQCISTES